MAPWAPARSPTPPLPAPSPAFADPTAPVPIRRPHPTPHSPASDLSAAFTLGCDVFDEIDGRAARAAAAAAAAPASASTGRAPPLLAGIDEEDDATGLDGAVLLPGGGGDDDLLADLDGLDLAPPPSRGMASSYAAGFETGGRLSPRSAAHAGAAARFGGCWREREPSVAGSLAESTAYGSYADGSSAYGSLASSATASRPGSFVGAGSVPSLAAATHPLAAALAGFALSPAHAAAPSPGLRRVPSAPAMGWVGGGGAPASLPRAAPPRPGARSALGPRGSSGSLPRRGGGHPLSATPPALKASASMPAFASARGRVSRPARRPLDDDAADDDAARARKLHNPWTLDETEALVAGVEACGGGKWADIKKLNLPAIDARSAVDLKDKWRNLTRLVTLPSALPRALARPDGATRRLPGPLLDRVRALLPPADEPYGRLTPSRIPGARSRARARR